MGKNTLAKTDWSVAGPKALEWLAAEAPRRTTLRRLSEDCVTALGLQVESKRFLDWLSSRQHREEWNAIKRTLGTGNGSHGPTGPSASSSSPVAGSGLTILEDDRQREIAEDRERCPVCKLSPAVREQVAEAKRAGLTQARILRSMARVHNITIASNVWAHHINVRHEV